MLPTKPIFRFGRPSGCRNQRQRYAISAEYDFSRVRQIARADRFARVLTRAIARVKRKFEACKVFFLISALDTIMSNNELEHPAAAEVGNQGKERIDVDQPNNVNEKTQMEEEVPVRQAKRGAPVHRIWSDAFDEPDVYSTRLPNNAICKHCKQSVRHHHKTLSVETHVRKCRPIQEDHVGHGRG